MKLQAKKSLGQHFLNSKHVLNQIIETANVQNNELVLEIGPGTGVLTEALLKTNAKVIAIEKDIRSVELLVNKFSESIKNKQLEIIHGDILDPSNGIIPEKPYLIVANIPYYITGAILEKFLENKHKPNRMVLLIQKEVADRIVANDNKESVLSISVKAFGQAKIIAKVSPGAFIPPPTVDSAILAIENIQEDFFTQNNVEISDFFKIVKAGFAHKRKFAIRNLEEIIDITKLENIWNILNMDLKIRSEKIDIKQWMEISKLSK